LSLPGYDVCARPHTGSSASAPAVGGAIMDDHYVCWIAVVVITMVLAAAHCQVVTEMQKQQVPAHICKPVQVEKQP
jgi:hypothetical protein